MAITTIIIFLLVLGVIVFVHELGHFSTAKYFGVKVDEFGLGFPPKIVGRKKGETEYTLNWIPLGGFVKIVGEDGENREDPRSFGAKPAWQRITILAAGVAMNFLLAIVIFSGIFMAGFPTDVSEFTSDQLPQGTVSHIQVTAVTAGSAAEEAGIALMDNILEADGNELQEVADLQDFAKAHPNQNVTLTIDRQGKVSEKEISVRANDAGQGTIGISIAKVATISYPPLESIKQGFAHTINLTLAIFDYLYTTVRDLVYTGSTTAEVSGPVGMVTMTNQVAQLGIITLLNFIALISINLGIINILPLPALDGGRIMFVLIEKIKGSPVSQKFEAEVHSLGFMLLMLLMAIVTLQDLAKLGLWSKLTGLF